jgi:lactoylglutathione lyase
MHICWFALHIHFKTEYIMRIEHVAIWTGRLEELKEFYVTYFGGTANALYTNPFKEFSSYFISFGSGARLELMHKPSVPQTLYKAGQEFTGITHLAFSAGSREEVNLLTEKMRIAGITIAGEPRQTGDGYYESVILDPDGNRIEITA